MRLHEPKLHASRWTVAPYHEVPRRAALQLKTKCGSLRTLIFVVRHILLDMEQVWHILPFT